MQLMPACEQFDPRSPAFRADPYPVYEVLRRESPVHHRPAKNDWLVTRYADVVALLKDRRLGLASPSAQDEASDPGGGPYKLLIARTLQALRLWLNFQEPPDHTRLGVVLHGSFHPDDRSMLRARIQRLADRLIERAVERRAIDVVKDLAGPLTSAVIEDILGIPESARKKLQHLTHEIHYLLDLDRTPGARERGLLALMALTEYFNGLIAERRSDHRDQDNLISVLLRAKDRGEISDLELLAQCTMVLVIGQINSKLLITSGVFTLLNRPEQLRLLRARPELLDTAINEVLRFEAPTQVVSRLALEDVLVGETLVRQGSIVRLLIGAANRDPGAFQDAAVFDVARTPNPHVSFGHGLHYCLGAMLAKLEAHVTIGTLLRSVSSMEIAEGGVQWEDMFVMRGLRSLPVVFD